MLVELNGFNTQPPEGGWSCFNFCSNFRRCFNTQPPEGGWDLRYKQVRTDN